MNQPNTGAGPANWAGGDPASPNSPFNSTMNYSDMAKQSVVSSYNQPFQMPLYNSIMGQERYSYGVPAGQNVAGYNRQAEINRISYSAAVANAGVGLASWASGAMAGAVFGGIPGFAISMAASSLPPFSSITSAVNRVAEQQRYSSSIARDVEMYKDRSGLGNISYNQASILGGRMASGMFKPMQFFSAPQQMDIYKGALANDLLSASGRGMDSGTISQYSKNFEKLLDTTKMIIKTLNTTASGAMSLMKELKDAGFTNMDAIRSQVIQAKGFGTYTGMGAQNMMQLGMAGSQAVAGTPWAPNVGASMYQTGAVSAASIARGSPAGEYMVRRMGGVAQAGAAIGNFQMNVLSSNYGSKAAAYMMNTDGSVNQGKMNQLMNGGVTGYDMVMGASKTGYNMGFNKMLFPFYKEDLYNNMNDVQRGVVTQRTFEAWGSQGMEMQDKKLRGLLNSLEMANKIKG